MHRQLILIKDQRFGGWGCSICTWVFNPSDFPVGNSIAEMKQDLERKCDRDFANHACAEDPIIKNTE